MVNLNRNSPECDWHGRCYWDVATLSEEGAIHL